MFGAYVLDTLRGCLNQLTRICRVVTGRPIARAACSRVRAPRRLGPAGC